MLIRNLSVATVLLITSTIPTIAQSTDSQSNTFSAPLQGQVDAQQLNASTSQTILQGGTDVSASPLTSVQRRINTRVPSVNLKPRVPLLAPNEKEGLNAEIDRSKSTVDPYALQLMKGDLARKRPSLYGNLLTPQIPDLGSFQLPRSPQTVPSWDAQQLQNELQRARRTTAMPQIPGNTVNTPVEAIPTIPTRPNEDLTSELERERQRATVQSAPDLSRITKAQLARTKPQMDAELARASFEMNTQIVLRKVHANVSMPNAEDALDQNIDWDSWYARVAKMSEPRLIAALERYGCPAGTNSVFITVFSNHRILVRIATKGPSDFDAATVEGYAALDGNPHLEFPQGSKRPSVSFLIDNSRNEAGSVSGVSSHPVEGDRE